MIEPTGRSLRELCHTARRALGIDDLVLVIHDASFPGARGGDTGDIGDIGPGSPYSPAASRLLEFADGLGFTGLQLGPQGITTPFNRSPYDGTVFSRNPRSIALGELRDDPRWESLLTQADLDASASASPAAARASLQGAADMAHARALDLAFLRFQRAASAAMRTRFQAFCAASEWLAHDVAFEGHCVRHGTDDDARWPGEERSSEDAPGGVAERYAFVQFLAHAQHADFRHRVRRLGWKLFGDVQIGLSPRDRWRRSHLFLPRYALGAPPSRTDPRGQPWGYDVLLPESPDARAFFRARVRKMAGEYDGLRIDHPHGLVCPWVYERGARDPFEAIAKGARLFESPDIPGVGDHPDLAAYAIVRSDQIDRALPRYADGWVRSIDPEQVGRYAERLTVVVEELAAAGGARSDVMCEVLSTAPRPLVEVLRRLGLGRFRVTQKANVDDPGDGYRSENAEPRDWIMVGTHDTSPLAEVVDGWFAAGVARRRARYLAERLAPDPEERAALAERLEGRPGPMIQAMFADMLASPARHALVFMSDLFGLAGRYNAPGTIQDSNWTLRVPNDFERGHAANVATERAMDVPAAFARALRARRHELDGAGLQLQALASELDRLGNARRLDGRDDVDGRPSV
jgi:4-alpha-glucanotransferase